MTMLTLPRVPGPIRVAVILSTETILLSFVVGRHVTHVTDGWQKIAITLAMHTGVRERPSGAEASVFIGSGRHPSARFACSGQAKN
jgi:hypothetical protein